MNPRFALLLLVAGCAGPSTTPASAPSPAATSIEADASSVTVSGLTVTRPDNWEFVTGDPSMGPDSQLVLMGPDGSGPVRASISFFRKKYEYRTRRPSAEQLLTAFMVSKRQELAGLEMVNDPERVEIAGHEGARLTVRVTELTASGESAEQLANVYAVVDGDHYWAIYALVPDGSGAGTTVVSVIDSLTL
ncbi:MAG: hypothetical protein AAF654_04750 [Myxococcota bacterium]